MSAGPLKLALFYATIGTGHKAAAEALRGWLAVERPGAKCLCRDVLDYVPGWIRSSVRGAYLGMARSAPWLWGALYNATDRPARRRGGAWEALNGFICGSYVSRLIAELDGFGADAVVATHFFGMNELVASGRAKVPICLVETDVVSHAMQRTPGFARRYAGSVESLRQHGVDGLAESARYFGIPVAPVYANPPARAASRAALGLDPDRTAVLVAGGGIGAGALGDVVDSMLHRRDWQITLLCGNNESLLERLSARYFGEPNVRVEGFSRRMPEHYAASDAVVLKPGGLSVAEATAVGAATFIVDPLPCQETFNSDYLLENGAAVRIYENRAAGSRIAEVLADEARVARLRANALALGRPFAGRDIVRDVAALVGR